MELHAVTLLEAINTSATVYQLLAAGIKRMALGANFHLEFAFYGPGGKRLAAGTAHYGLTVSGMDVFPHIFSSFLEAPVGDLLS